MTNAYECTTQPQRSQAADPLRTRDFRLLVAGLGISLFANLMLRFAMSMWVLDETGSAATFASILTASILPTILLSPLGGVMADRTNRRTVMVALDALSAVTVLVCVAIFSAAGFNLAAIAVMQVVLVRLSRIRESLCWTKGWSTMCRRGKRGSNFMTTNSKNESFLGSLRRHLLKG